MCQSRIVSVLHEEAATPAQHVRCVQGETAQEMAGLTEALQAKAVPVHTSCDGELGLSMRQIIGARVRTTPPVIWRRCLQAVSSVCLISL